MSDSKMSDSKIKTKLKDLSGMKGAIDNIVAQAWERGYKYGLYEAKQSNNSCENVLELGELVMVHGCKGLVVRRPYSIGVGEPKTILCRVLMKGGYLLEPKIEEVIKTGATYPCFADAVEALKEADDDE